MLHTCVLTRCTLITSVIKPISDVVKSQFVNQLWYVRTKKYIVVFAHKISSLTNKITHIGIEINIHISHRAYRNSPRLSRWHNHYQSNWEFENISVNGVRKKGHTTVHADKWKFSKHLKHQQTGQIHYNWLVKWISLRLI